MRLEWYVDAAGEFRWRLVAVNGRILAVSSESYVSKGNVERALETVLAGLADIAEHRVEPEAVT